MRRYANYKYHGKKINNLGDHVQILTIDYLYSLMGIKKEDIIYIDINELSSYDGEEVYLPVSMPLVNYSERGVASMFSDKITPVFFGMTTPKETMTAEEIEYYKAHEPIGCRDEQAYNTMMKYGINAYLGGCLTVTLPKRKPDSEKQKKIFIVDVPEKFKEHIPPEIASEAVWDTHIFYDYIDNPTQKSMDRYKLYQDEAKLLITGLLHGSVPCAAFGIPVVLARDCVSYRFAWIEALLKIHTPEDYSDINWNPDSIDFEEHKDMIRKLFIKRMSGKSAEEEMNYAHDFYMHRERKEYQNDVFFTIKSFIDTVWLDKDHHYKYAVWGLTQMAELTVDYISEHYPNAELTHVYDIQENKTFRGTQATDPEKIVESPDETVFVTTVSAADAAERFFTKINKPKQLYKTLKIIR